MHILRKSVPVELLDTLDTAMRAYRFALAFDTETGNRHNRVRANLALAAYDRMVSTHDMAALRLMASYSGSDTANVVAFGPNEAETFDLLVSEYAEDESNHGNDVEWRNALALVAAWNDAAWIEYTPTVRRAEINGSK